MSIQIYQRNSLL